jgi:Fic-DOC domain mobile mystery protein B
MGERIMQFSYPEGATPIDDISGLKPFWVKSQGDLNMAEAENIFQAVHKYLGKTVPPAEKWFTVSQLKKIHSDMFSEVWDWAGKFRTTQTIPGIPPYLISEALKNLCEDVLFWQKEESELSLLERAAIIHHRLVFIHPYSNGNGRFSRLVSDRYLKSLKCSFPNWPVDLGEDGEHRKQYISALKKADEGDYIPLVLYMSEHGAKEEE